MNRSKKLKRIRLIADTVIILCLLAIAVICVVKIYGISKDYDENQAKYEEIAVETRDFDALKKINPDVVGWIRCDDTLIDYPIVQGEDNDKYLDTMVDGSWSSFGTLFVDYITIAPFEQFNTIIYGHHMRNGSMFAPLKEWRKKEYAEEHPFVLFTPEKTYDLMVWCFLNVPADSKVYATNLASDEKGLYLNEVKRKAEYLTDIEVDEDSKLVVLSTCAYEYDDARYVVVCKMVERKETYRLIPQEKKTKKSVLRELLGIEESGTNGEG